MQSWILWISVVVQNGVTALIAASKRGQLEVVKFLLQMVAQLQVNAQSKVYTYYMHVRYNYYLLRTHMKSGWTALMCAAYGNHHAIVAELLAHGADTELGTAAVYFIVQPP